MALELGREPDPDLATRTGEFAMLLYSIGIASDFPYKLCFDDLAM